MRDGIFKTAPLPKKWHAFGRRAEREADHGERLVDALDEALREDIKKIIDGGLKGVVGIVTDGQFSILKGDDLRDFFKGLKLESRFEQDVVQNIQFICRGGRVFDSQAFIDAFSRASKRHVNAIKADMLGHANKNTDKVHLKTVADGINAAIESVDYSAAVREVLLGVKGDSRKKDHSFDLSEDLSG